ncbi:hypothetical protein [Methylobacterium radiodurans]|uniref:hypothetical protein n=1 Tax=Methylobacterium radiodurans TaxID=2202828 RepID=UPI0013A54968|nr:hypothetical protein [Methylobacterium radiodurans]
MTVAVGPSDSPVGRLFAKDDTVPNVLRTAGGAYAVTENGLWWPGLYESPEAARRATGFREEVLSGLQKRKNVETCNSPGIITAADLDALVRPRPVGCSACQDRTAGMGAVPDRARPDASGA